MIYAEGKRLQHEFAAVYGTVQREVRLFDKAIAIIVPGCAQKAEQRVRWATDGKTVRKQRATESCTMFRETG